MPLLSSRLLWIAMLAFVTGRAEAQECKPVVMDGSSDAMVEPERQNYLRELPAPLTKAQEALAVKALKESGFARYTADGCYVRAHLLSRLLEQGGIKNIFKTWIFAPSYYTFFMTGDVRPKNASAGWSYHVAVSYVDRHGTRKLMDPAIDSKNALSEKEWLSRLRCAPGTLVLRTESSRWLPATVTTDANMQQEGFYGHGRNPFNGFIFSADASTPGYVASHLARDDVADRYSGCAAVSSASSSALLGLLNTGSDTLTGPGCEDVLSFFEARKLEWSRRVSPETAEK